MYATVCLCYLYDLCCIYAHAETQLPLNCVPISFTKLMLQPSVVMDRSAPNSPKLLSHMSHRTLLVVPIRHAAFLATPTTPLPLQLTDSTTAGGTRRRVLEHSTVSLRIPSSPSHSTSTLSTFLPRRFSLGMGAWLFAVLVVICLHDSGMSSMLTCWIYSNYCIMSYL
eukprot:GHVQ01011045.1.p1 GENE.GHVQ01011045.1~~GHVQ01011045.1.p1  ORF type:complete len:168 (+),score=19.77 GHVQ01011045.1:301-804(+)